MYSGSGSGSSSSSGSGSSYKGAGYYTDLHGYNEMLNSTISEIEYQDYHHIIQQYRKKYQHTTSGSNIGNSSSSSVISKKSYHPLIVRFLLYIPELIPILSDDGYDSVIPIGQSRYVCVCVCVNV